MYFLVALIEKTRHLHTSFILSIFSQQSTKNIIGITYMIKYCRTFENDLPVLPLSYSFTMTFEFDCYFFVSLNIRLFNMTFRLELAVSAWLLSKICDKCDHLSSIIRQSDHWLKLSTWHFQLTLTSRFHNSEFKE